MSGFNIGDLLLRVLADDAGFQADLQKKAAKAGDAAGRTLGQRLKAGLTPERIGTAMGAVFGGIAAAGARMGDKVDNALDSIRVGTGATGEALRGLEDDFKAVSSRVPDDIEDVGQAIADLNTRTGQTGKGLQDLAVSILDLSRITKTDVNANVRNATRLFGDWSIATEDQAATLDKVYRASQATGIGVDALMEKVVDFGSPLRLLGFQFEESIALLSKWEKEGVNTETALTGLKFSVKTLAREGVPASEMAKTLQERIAAIGKSADPVGDSISLFGLRAGPDLAAAILEGRFATEDLLEVIKNGSDTIAQSTRDTEGLGEAFAKFGNWVTVSFGGMFTAFAGLGNLVYIFPAVGGAFGKMAGKIIGSSGAVRSALESVALKGMYLADAMASSIDRIPGSAKVKAAIGRTRGFLGRTLGAGLVIGVSFILLSKVVEDIEGFREQRKQIADQFKLTDAEALAVQLANMDALGRSDALRRGAGQSFKNMGTTYAQALADAIRVGAPIPAAAAQELVDKFGMAAIPVAEKAGEATGEAVVDGVADGIAGAAGAVAGALGSALTQREVAEEAGAETVESYVSGVLDQQDSVKSAFESFKNLLRNALTPGAQIARNIGILTSKALAKGLDDKRPEVRAAALLMRDQAEADLAKLIAGGGKVGKKAGEELKEGLKSKNPKIRAAAERVQEIVTAELEGTKKPAGDAGEAAGEAFVRRLRASIAGSTINVRIGTIGGHGRAAGGPVEAGQPYWVGERGPELIVPEVNSRVLSNTESMAVVRAGGPGGAAGGGDTYTINMPVSGALPVRTIRDIQTELVRAGDLGIVPARELPPMYARREATA